MEAKQVIVMKKFPKARNMRIGKYIAQGSHASLGPILGLGRIENDNLIIPLDNPFVRQWLTERFKKVALYVETDEELVHIYNAAKEAGLPASLIQDSGLTEFNGVPTLTAVGVGPGDPEQIDKITGKLSLF